MPDAIWADDFLEQREPDDCTPGSGSSTRSNGCRREAFVEAGRLASTGQIMQHVVASSGDILIDPEQMARMSGDAGIPRE